MLREEQIQRYSRHILLKEVGGKGQRALLEAQVLVEGRSRAIDTALAYLAASGSPVNETPAAPDEKSGQQRPDPAEGDNANTPQGAQAPRWGFWVGQTTAAFAPDANAASVPRAWLGPLTRWSQAPEHLIRVGLGRSLILAAGPQTPVSASFLLEASSEWAEPVAQGALAGLVLQRWVLGLETGPLVVLRWKSPSWVRE
jgi:hypothetical protein